MFLLDMQNYLLLQEQATAGRTSLHVARKKKKERVYSLVISLCRHGKHMGKWPNKAILPVHLKIQLDTEECVETAQKKRWSLRKNLCRRINF